MYNILNFIPYPSLSLSLQLFFLGYVMYSFNQFWLDANPENIMAFSRERDRFISELKRRLKERPLTIELSLED